MLGVKLKLWGHTMEGRREERNLLEEMKFEFFIERWLPSRQTEGIQQAGGMGWRAAHCGAYGTL